MGLKPRSLQLLTNFSWPTITKSFPSHPMPFSNWEAKVRNGIKQKFQRYLIDHVWNKNFLLSSLHLKFNLNMFFSSSYKFAPIRSLASKCSVFQRCNKLIKLSSRAIQTAADGLHFMFWKMAHGSENETGAFPNFKWFRQLKFWVSKASQNPAHVHSYQESIQSLEHCQACHLLW